MNHIMLLQESVMPGISLMLTAPRHYFYFTGCQCLPHTSLNLGLSHRHELEKVSNKIATENA